MAESYNKKRVHFIEKVYPEQIYMRDMLSHSALSNLKVILAMNLRPQDSLFQVNK